MLDRSLHPQNKCGSSNCRQFETKQPATAERFRDPISGLAGSRSHCSAAAGSPFLRREQTNLAGSAVPARGIRDYRGRRSIAGTRAVRKSLASSITRRRCRACHAITRPPATLRSSSRITKLNYGVPRADYPLCQPRDRKYRDRPGTLSIGEHRARVRYQTFLNGTAKRFRSPDYRIMILFIQLRLHARTIC